MQRRALLVALVAGVAVLAFGVGAATLDDALAAPDPTLDGGDPPPKEGASGPSPPDDPGVTGSCDGCGSNGISVVVATLLPAVPPVAVLALAALGTLVLAMLWRRAGAGTTGGIERTTATHRGLDSPRDQDGGSRVSIDQPPQDNAVYRAWAETMGRLEDRHRSSTTPGEDAAAARRNGWDAATVATLTDCFERVRYGREDVTDERADEAREAADRLSEESS